MPHAGQKTEPLLRILEAQPVIPVLKIDRIEDAVPLARALARGGLPAIEITLRTPVALEAIRRAASEVPEAIVGAGTILNARQFAQAEKAGARFIVSPGTTAQVVDAAADSAVPLLPGAATPSEIMAALENRRRGLSEIIVVASGRRAVLPDRRHRHRQCARLSRPAQRDLCRRLMGRARQGPGARRMGRNRTSGARGIGSQVVLTNKKGAHPAPFPDPFPETRDQLVPKRATDMNVTALPVNRLTSSAFGAACWKPDV